MVALCLEIIEKFSGRSLLFGNALPEKTRYCTENSDEMWKKLRPGKKAGVFPGIPAAQVTKAVIFTLNQ
jgi:hypothetical protein